MRPIDLEGEHTKAAIEHPAKPATTIGVHTTDTNGGTVKADVKSAGSWWSLTAWYQWARGKGRSAGADAEIKF